MAVIFMSKISSKEPLDSDTELLAEYHFDYQTAQPNLFAKDDSNSDGTVVILDPDVAKIFPDSVAVNEALRLIAQIAQAVASKTSE